MTYKSKILHDSVKHFADGKGTYETVCKNLKYAITHGVATTIRCNYTNANIESFIDLINDFKPFWQCKTLRFSFHKVWQEPESEELFRKRDRLKRFIVDSEINSNINTYLGNSVNSCYADYDNNVAINYNGDIYRCTARDFKPEHRLGTLAALGEIIYNKNNEIFGKNKLTRQCPTCKILPICTICFQQRVESPSGNCPKPLLRENAAQNIHKYFYDTKYYSSL